MASVGVLAAIVNIVVLLTVACVDRIIELVVRNFAASRLRKERRAPVVHDSDTWLPNIPRSMVKYHKHPAILVTVICAVFLIASEIVTELGVDVSNTCSPVKKSAAVITRGDSSNSFTEVELGTSAFFLQSIKFLDGDLTRVPSGLPRSIKGTECIKCMKPEQYPDILNGCTVTDEKVYGPGELSVSILTTDGPFKTITDVMTEIGGLGRTFRGKGDLTNNGMHWSAFLFYTDNDDVIYLEYSNQKHVPILVQSARGNNPQPGPIETPVTAKRISCTKNELSITNFRDAVSIYRTIQLENTINPATFVPDQHAFKNLTANDAYRAGLSVKVIDDDLTQGEYFEYTSCGRYNWIFLMPIMACIIAIIILFILSIVLGSGLEAKKIPYNSRSWFRHSQLNRGVSMKSKGRLARARSGYFESIFDEMVVLEEGRGNSVRIGLRSRDGKIAPLAGSPIGMGFVSDYKSDMQFANEIGEPGDVVVTNEVEMPAEPNEMAPDAIAPNEHAVGRH